MLSPWIHEIFFRTNEFTHEINFWHIHICNVNLYMSYCFFSLTNPLSKDHFPVTDVEEWNWRIVFPFDILHSTYYAVISLENKLWGFVTLWYHLSLCAKKDILLNIVTLLFDRIKRKKLIFLLYENAPFRSPVDKFSAWQFDFERVL